MNLTPRIAELKRKHEALSEEVETAVKMPGIDALQVAELKKQKLALKEEIQRLQTQ